MNNILIVLLPLFTCSTGGNEKPLAGLLVHLSLSVVVAQTGTCTPKDCLMVTFLPISIFAFPVSEDQANTTTKICLLEINSLIAIGYIDLLISRFASVVLVSIGLTEKSHIDHSSR